MRARLGGRNPLKSAVGGRRRSEAGSTSGALSTACTTWSGHRARRAQPSGANVVRGEAAQAGRGRGRRLRRAVGRAGAGGGTGARDVDPQVESPSVPAVTVPGGDGGVDAGGDRGADPRG